MALAGRFSTWVAMTLLSGCFVDSGGTAGATVSTSSSTGAASSTSSTTAASSTASTSTTEPGPTTEPASTTSTTSTATTSTDSTTGSTGQASATTTGVDLSTGAGSTGGSSSGGDVDVPACPQLYFEDFSKQPTLKTQGGMWTWDQAQGHYNVTTDPGAASYAYVADESWQDVAVYTRFQIVSGAGWVSVRAHADIPNTSYYYAGARVSQDVAIRLGRVLGGVAGTYDQNQLNLSLGTWYVLRFELSGGTLTQEVDGMVLNHADNSLASGSVAIGGLDAAEIRFDWLLVCAAK